MLCADITTHFHGNDGVSTVRGTHDRISSNIIKKLSGMFFSTSQLGATIICSGFFQNTYSPILVFSTLPPIQTSAFRMTLIRKNIINKSIWQIVYGAELALVYVLWFKETGNIIVLPISLFCYGMRKLNVNKYFLFLLLGLMDNLWRQINKIV